MSTTTGLIERKSGAESASRNSYRFLILLSLGHFFIDLYSIALGTLQPLLVRKFSLSLTQAGILGGALVFSSSVMQPAYGYLSDRYHTKLFSALAPAVAAVFMCVLGLAPGFEWLLVLVVCAGAGVASFHPQASAQATLGIAANRQKWFAVFISAGTLGMALGPAYFALVLERFPIESAWLGAIPGVAIAAMLLVWLPGPGAEAASVRKRVDWTPLAAVWKPLSLLYALVFIRSIVQVTYAQSLVLYLSRERGFTFTQSTFALSLYLTAGALGGFVGGHLADRFGGRRVIMISMIGCVPFLCLFFLATGTLALVGLALGGLFLLFTIPVNVVMAQELVPSQAGTVSALMMGFAWGMAGLIFIPLTGWVADHTSMNTALSALSLFPVLGFFLTLKLPKNL